MDSTRSTSLQQGKNLLKDLDEFLAMSPESLTVIDLEKEIVKRRDKLLYSLRDPIIYKEFTRFMSNSKSIDFLWAVNLFFSISFYPTIMKAIYGVQENLCLWVAFEFVSEVITFLSACVVCGCIREESIFRRASQWLLSCTNAKSPEALADFFHTIFYISIMLARSIDLVQRSVAGECKSSDWSGAFACNPNAKTGGFPIESFCILLSVPVLFVCALREIRFYLNLTAWMIGLFAIIFSAYQIHSPQTFPLLSFYFLYQILILYDSLKQSLLFYLLNRQLKKMIEANQRLAVQNKATEMRHLIANVAHDLKTPLSSFMTGIDIISADIIECMLKLKSSPNKLSSSIIERTEGIEEERQEDVVTKEYLASMMSGLQSCIVNIRNTNAFMLMTINRCLDYTKASNGLKLVPKNETIDLQETINMPLQCMTNIQNKMKITLQPYEGEGICSHIITDRQWLQENLLCLLSNAVKYSGEGEVLIVVSKVPAYKGVRPGEEDHHPASPIKLCSSIEDEVIVKAPETVVVHRQPSTAFFSKKSFGFHSRKSVSSGFSGHSSHFSFMRSQMFHDPVSMNSGAYESIMTSMRSRRGFIGTNKVSPQSQQTIISPPKPGQSIRRTVSHLENPSDFESQRHVKVEQTAPTRNRISRASYISHNSNVSHDTNLSPATADPMLSQRTCNEELMFEVIDPGIGIAEEAMKSLFNPFKQTQRLAGGTGLGLYSLAKRIEALKGKYGVHQRVDGKQGSVFWFTIPYRADTVTAAALIGGTASAKEKSGYMGGRETHDHGMMTSQLHGANVEGGGNTNSKNNSKRTVDVGNTSSSSPKAVSIHAKPPANQTQNLSVLIVEDTPSIAKMTSMMLKRQKHRTEVAENGQIALKMLYEEETKDVERFKKESKEGEGEVEGRVGGVCSDVSSEGVRYDVVLMDLQMPVMDGLEATRRIRGREKEKMTRHQIVIGVSANSDHETMEEAFKAGIDDFLPKPFSMEAFLKAVQRIQMKLSGASEKISQHV